MLFKNVASQKIHIYAYDSTTGAAKTGDAANITAYVSLDGTANAVDDTNPAEVDSTNMPGVYVFELTQAETNCDSFALYAKSSTANIRIEPIIGFTTGAAVTQTGDSYAKINDGTIGLSNLKTLIDAISSKTTNLPASPAAVGSAMTLTAAYDAAKNAGTSTLTAQQVWEYATRTLSAFGFGVTVTTNNDKSGYALTVTPPTAADIKSALEADGSKLDHLWETTEDDGGVRRFTTNALEQAPSSSGGGVTAEAVRIEMDANSTKLASIATDTNKLQTDWADGGRLDLILDAAGSAGDPWITELPGSYAAGTAGYIIGHMQSQGAGAITWTYTLTDSVSGNPIDGAEVWVSSDSVGSNVIASGTTNQSGIVTFYLDAGTVYLWRKKSGYNFTNPDQETVS